jgi:hypothetical protein
LMKQYLVDHVGDLESFVGKIWELQFLVLGFSSLSDH